MKILKKISTEYSPIHALWNRNPVSLLTGGCKTVIIIISSEDISREYTYCIAHILREPENFPWSIHVQGTGKGWWVTAVSITAGLVRVNGTFQSKSSWGNLHNQEIKVILYFPRPQTTVYQNLSFQTSFTMNWCVSELKERVKFSCFS